MTEDNPITIEYIDIALRISICNTNQVNHNIRTKSKPHLLIVNFFGLAKVKFIT